MKTPYLATAALAAVSLVPVTGLLAQTSTTTPTHTPPTAAQMVANKVTRLTTLLSLTSTQQTQATAIFTTEETAVSGLFSSMKAARTALKTAVEANDQATIATQATQIGSLTAQEVQAHATADAAFYALLTADQQTKFASLRHGGPMGDFAGHRGGPGF